MSTHTWTDRLGRTYEYETHDADLIADAEFAFAPGAVLALTEAASAIAVQQVALHGASGLAAVLYRSESGASSIIEGLDVRPRRILEAEYAQSDEVNDAVASRIVANLRGLEDALTLSAPATERDILRWHRILMEGDPHIRKENVGAWRSEQNWIGGDTTGPRGAVYIPPKQDAIPTLAGDLVRFVARDDLDWLTQALIAHAQFEVVHPFTDGNGRVGRMLLQHVAAQRRRRMGEAVEPVPVSVIWSRDTERYIDGLRMYQAGEISLWLEFAATTMLETADWMRQTAAKLDTLISELAARAQTRLGSTGSKIVQDLLQHPLVDAPAIAKRYSVSSQYAHRVLDQFVQRGVLHEQAFARATTARGRPRRVFASPDLLDLLGAV